MAKLDEKQMKYLHDYDFLNEYVRELENRITYSNNKLEEDGIAIDEFYAAEHPETLRDNLKVFRMFLEKIKYINDLKDSFEKTTDEETKNKIKYHLDQEEKITQEFIIKVADTINKHTPYISLGYRTIDTGVMFNGKYPIEKVSNIKDAMKNLLDKYYDEWSNLDVFEKEAKFNIEFLRIHPFEDGNGRTSRLILNYNLLLQGHAPVVLPSSVKEAYFDARNKEDVKWIKELFERESEKELKALNSLIEDYEEENERGYTL